MRPLRLASFWLLAAASLAVAASPAWAQSIVTGGGPTCIPAPGDFDGDGDIDFAQLCSGAWHFYNANGSYIKGIWTGAPQSAFPVPADYDGDGITDVVFFDAGAWHFYNYTTGTYDSARSRWTGSDPSAVPVPLDFNGDGFTDKSLYSLGAWHFFNENGSYLKGIWVGNTAGNIPVPFDRDGDGDEDPVLFNNNNSWHFFDFATGAYQGGVMTPRPGGGAYTNPRPAPLDLDGDGKPELGVYEVVGGTGFWHFFSVNGTFLRTVNTGAASTDRPISRRMLP
ncbi:MAG TPA: VCBS repeat-containing protein [Thermoanaerobaculia bacterium]|jgi:hypothetical protein|nr:VCBS repeat-containing protein [Thermoanaerobaculia bacterium]